MSQVMEKLAEEYPQLYLNPDRTEQNIYRQVVLQGEEPMQKSLLHYQGDDADGTETVDTPVGPVRVVTLGNRKDFELVIRGMMAAKKGPQNAVPDSQGAAMLTAYNWGRIHAHMKDVPEEQQQAEFQKFTSVKENYVDYLVILSRGPYSGVTASAAGFGQEEWLELSDTIRRYHELTHVICRRLYPGDIDEIRDELIADAVGLYAAFGRFSAEMEKLFLGITGDAYTGGRLENYTPNAPGLTPSVCGELSEITQWIDSMPGAKPFDLIPGLMKLCRKLDDSRSCAGTTGE